MPIASRLRQHLFTPPYPLLPLAVFTYIAICFLLHPLSPLRTGELADPDDYMRLVEVTNWLNGASWFDLGQPRMSPGAGTVIHWSRLIDLPLAAIAWPLRPLIGLPNALFAAALVLPLIWLGCALALVAALAAAVVGREQANLAGLFLLFAPQTLYNLTPGRAGHHGPQTLIAGFGLLCLAKLFGAEKGAGRYALAAALAFAAGFWLGTEGLPWFLVFIACLALAAAWQGGALLRQAALFGAALAVFTTLAVPLALPPAEYTSRALSWFSPAYAILAGLTAAVLAALWALGRLTDRRWLRLALLLGLGGFAMVVFAALVPDSLRGPFADYDDFNATIALANITEAQPLLKALYIDWLNHIGFGAALVNFCRALLLPLLALGVCAVNARRDADRRLFWLAQGAFLLAATLLTVFWQVRVGWFMQLFTIVPLTQVLVAASAGLTPSRRIGLFLLLAPLPVVLLPAAYDNAKFASDVLLFPAAREAKSCNPHRAAVFLRDAFRDRPQVILTGANEGPELLYRTPHDVIAGNFNVPANRDVFEFFNARDDGVARSITDKWQADLVLVCAHIPPFYAGYERPRLGHNLFLKTGADGKLQLGGDPQHPALIERLVNGAAPGWLKPIVLPADSGYFLYRIQPRLEVP